MMRLLRWLDEHPWSEMVAASRWLTDSTTRVVAWLAERWWVVALLAAAELLVALSIIRG